MVVHCLLTWASLCDFFFFSSRRRHTRCYRDWSSDVCSSDLLALIASAPSVEYHVRLIGGRGTVVVDNPSLLPPAAEIEAIEEPWVSLSVVSPATYIGTLMELTRNRRGDFRDMERSEEHTSELQSR